MLHTAYAVELYDYRTGKIVARGIFSEANPTLMHLGRLKTRVIGRGFSRNNFGKAAQAMLSRLWESGIKLELLEGWQPPPSEWPKAYR